MPDPADMVFIHGLADITKQWHRTRPFFEAFGLRVHYFEYPTLSNDLDIPLIARSLEPFISDAVGTSSYLILAHSQGGLIAEWFDRFIGSKQLKRIVTIGTPYQGNMLPLFMRKTILERLPISRRQLEDLSCLSPFFREMIIRRLGGKQTRTSCAALIGHSSGFSKIESDGVVSVCSANPNAAYYLSIDRKIRPLTSPPAIPFFYVRTHHLPVYAVRRLLQKEEPNPFARVLLSALTDGPILPTDDFVPKVGALVVPANIKLSAISSGTHKKIISRPSLDGKYLICFFKTNGLNTVVLIHDDPVTIVPGQFTYVVESSLLNTGT